MGAGRKLFVRSAFLGGLGRMKEHLEGQEFSGLRVMESRGTVGRGDLTPLLMQAAVRSELIALTDSSEGI